MFALFEIVFTTCLLSSSTLLWLFQVVNSVFIVSVCSRLLSVVVGCSLFRLFHALSSYFRLSRLFFLKKKIRRQACLNFFGLDQVDRKFNVLHQSWRDSTLLGRQQGKRTKHSLCSSCSCCSICSGFSTIV